eukprot:GEZU01003178.1.p1 GENE.GEZU01003178.1~~GEZU01003178.1.p1  ORF type:complete len:219 (-),score=18.26 GEZU01003178.1:172-828(-)
MSRFTLKAEAQDHVQAYLEYRMIVGDRDGGKLLNESEYEKLREDFYAKRRAGGFTQITYTNSFKSKGQLEGGEGSRLSSRLPSSNTSSGLKRMVTPTSATRGGSNRSNSLQGGVVIEEDDNNNNSDEEVPMFSRGGTYTRSTTSSSSSARKSSGTSSTKSNSQTSSSPYDLIKRYPAFPLFISIPLIATMIPIHVKSGGTTLVVVPGLGILRAVKSKT